MSHSAVLLQAMWFDHDRVRTDRETRLTESCQRIEEKGIVQVEAYQTVEAIESIAASWNKLALHMPQRTPMPSHAWVASYMEHRLKSRERFCCLAAFDNTELLGVLPVVIADRGRRRRCNAVIYTPKDEYTDGVDIAAKHGREAEVASLLAGSLEDRCEACGTVLLSRIPETSPTLEAFCEPVAGWRVLLEPAGYGAYIPADGSFEDYRASLGRNFRGNLNRTANRLGELPDIRTEFVTDVDHAVECLRQFMQVEASGWKGRAGTAIACLPSLMPFYESLAIRLAQAGMLEWQLLLSEDRVLAMNLAVRCGRSLMLYKLAYNEAFGKCAPGNMLLERVIERAFGSQDTAEINLSTDVDWYRNWRMARRRYYNVYLYPKRPVTFAFRYLPRKSKLLLRRVPGVLALYQRIRKAAEG